MIRITNDFSVLGKIQVELNYEVGWYNWVKPIEYNLMTRSLQLPEGTSGNCYATFTVIYRINN